jgi:hypothetical protein
MCVFYIYFSLVQITSYGGSLRYTISYETDAIPSFIRSPDAILAVSNKYNEEKEYCWIKLGI